MLFYCAMAHPTVVFHRQTILNAGGYSNSWKHCEDYELWLRLQRQGVAFANLPTPLLRLRKHTQNISTHSKLIQTHHAQLAAQYHLMYVLQSPVCLQLVQALRTSTKQQQQQQDASNISIGMLWTLMQLLQAFEHHCIHASFRRFDSCCNDSTHDSATSTTTMTTASTVLLSQAEINEIRSDCTKRMGELVMKSMQMCSSDSSSASSTVTTLASTHEMRLQECVKNESSKCSAAIASSMACFSVPDSAPLSINSSSSLMQLWIKRGPEAAMLLAKLMMK